MPLSEKEELKKEISDHIDQLNKSINGSFMDKNVSLVYRQERATLYLALATLVAAPEVIIHGSAFPDDDYEEDAPDFDLNGR